MKLYITTIFVHLLFSCTVDDEVDSSSFPILTKVEDLAEFYELSVDRTGQYESTKLIKYFDQSLELEYTYELLESEEFDPLYYSIIIEQEKSIRDARQAFSIGKGAISLVGNLSDQGTIEIDNLDLPGDQVYYALRTYENIPNGLLYKVRKGKVIYTMILSGLYSRDHSIVYDIILPKTKKLDVLNLRY